MLHMKADAPNVKVACFDSSVNIASFANSVEERSGSEGGNADLIRRYKYMYKDSKSLYRFRDYIVLIWRNFPDISVVK